MMWPFVGAPTTEEAHESGGVGGILDGRSAGDPLGWIVRWWNCNGCRCSGSWSCE